LTGPYPLASWTVPFIAGLLLSRLDLSGRRTQNWMLAGGGVLAVAAFVVADLFYAALGPAADTGYPRLLTGVGHGQMPLWLISSTAGALFVIAACEILFRRRPGLIGWLGVTGRFAFTIYVLHVLVL